MRARVNYISLLGGGRAIELTPGLNIIYGGMTSGKTPLLQLIHSLFGHGLEHLIPELRQHVTLIEGSVTFGEDEYTIIRPVTSTRDAKIDIAGDNETLRLPAMVPDATSDLTFGRWLLGRLGLPQVEIPVSMRVVPGASSPVSINDYFMYCHLRSREIATSVFGHQDRFKNVKRMVVFEVLYGIYNVELYELESQLRTVEHALRDAHNRETVLERSFAGTAFANRAVVVRLLNEAIAALEEVEHASVSSVEESARDTPTAASPQIQELRRRVLDSERKLSLMRKAADEENNAARQMDELARQLESQIRRLTKAIVADTHLLDFDFLQCPRCGSPVHPERVSEEQCYLCVQEPSPLLSRGDLEREQHRLDAQINETRELSKTHDQTASRLRLQAEEVQRAREEAGRQLDFHTRSYLSDAAEALKQQAAGRAGLLANITRYKDYLEIFERISETESEIRKLEEDADTLRAQLQSVSDRQSEAGARIRYLDRVFRGILKEFNIPHVGDPEATFIDRDSYLPVIDGRPFDALYSPGLIVQVNVAHALAHHLTALHFGIPLPGILIIDGLTRNLGNTGLSPERKHRMYEFLIHISKLYGDSLQLIIADDEVPDFAEPYVRVALTEEDRLVRYESGD
jgi:hypothetical protein